MPKAKPPAVPVLSSSGDTGKASADHVFDFIERGQRAQAAVDAIIADQPKRGRLKP